MAGGGGGADRGDKPGSGEEQEEEIESYLGPSALLKSPPLCAVRHGGRVWVFYSFSFTLRIRGRLVSRGPRQNNRKSSGQPLSPGPSQRSEQRARVSKCGRRGRGGGVRYVK